jgi:hypothetical protein
MIAHKREGTSMDETPDAGAVLLANLYRAIRDLHHSVFEMGFKVQALEYTLRSFPDTRPVYDEGLKLARTPEAVAAMDLSRKGYDSQIAQALAGTSHSA